jgi:glyoxylase-like metal-dependent hydrolase (beta-lactamase superfamily II)
MCARHRNDDDTDSPHRVCQCGCAAIWGENEEVIDPVLIAAGNPSPMTGAGNNTYLVIGAGRGAVLIDAGVGAPPHLADLHAVLDRHHARLAAVVVTHAHADHVSGAPALAGLYPEAVFWKWPWPEEDARYPVSWRSLEDGMAIPLAGIDLRVLHTPGHSPDHVVLQADGGTLFAGDIVSAAGRVAIPVSHGGNLGQYLASLERLLALEPRRLLPAHGPVIDQPARVIQQHLDHRRAREHQVIAALADGPKTVEAIADSIYDGLSPALRPAAVENVRAHLDKLSAEGRAFERGGHWNRPA